MTLVYRMIKPLLFRLDPERAHDLVGAALAWAERAPGTLALAGALLAFRDPILATECAGLRFANPIGLAAGFDKRATLVNQMAALGFGHVEVGTVTPRPQQGNPKPRMFRLPEDAALINRLGFNSPGMVAVAQQLRALSHTATEPQSYRAAHSPHPVSQSPDIHVIRNTEYAVGNTVIGVNIGKNRETALERAAEDYLAAFVALAPLADYVAVNISSPNTPGLRLLHERHALEELLGGLSEANRRLGSPRPIFLKISPDESDEQIETVVAGGLAAGVAGFIATNTTLAREGLRGAAAGESGGLSGRPLAARAQAVAQQVSQLAGGRAALIAVGGVWDAEDAYQRIRAGASLVQLYTALVYQGPGVAGQIARGLAQRLRRDGFRSAAEAVGADSLR